MFEDFDRDLVRQLFEAMVKGQDHIFRDPAYPYQATVKRDGEAYLITVEDTRKRWWGRVVDKRRVTEKPVSGSSTQGPAFEALWMIQHCIDADRGIAAQEEALKRR